MAEQLAAELAPTVRVNGVAPATVRTGFSESLHATGLAADSHYPLGRLGCPEDVASVVSFLAGPAAAWMTGQTVVLDGGHLTTAGIDIE